MSTVKKHAPKYHVGDWVSFTYGPGKAEARIVEDRGPIGVRGGRIYRVEFEADQETPSQFEVPETELEPTSTPTRLSFTVSYTRQKNSNVWRAVTRSDGIMRGVRARGAVGYSTASWRDESEADVNHASVTVFFEIDPRFGNPDYGNPFEGIPGIVRDAQALADEMFLSRHPGARIEHATFQG